MNITFETRELTVQELIWLGKAALRDTEAMVLLVESRMVDKSPDIRCLPVSDFGPLVSECLKSITDANEVTATLVSLATQR